MAETEPTDETLIASFKGSGRDEDLERLVRRHVPEVRRMIRAMVMSDADADDVTQEIFLNVVRGIADFRADARFTTWLYRISMNTAITFINRKRNSPVLYRESSPEEGSAPPAPREGDARREELNATLSRGMESLSPHQRSAIVLTYVRSLSGREAARIQGCPLPTFHWRLHKARQALRRQLQDQVR